MAKSADEERDEITRRDMIKMAAGAVIVAPIEVTRLAGPSLAAEKAPAFFTPEEFALVDELSEIIIPADDHSPGARAARVASYIDFELSESVDERPKKLWKQGLKLIDSLSKKM